MGGTPVPPPEGKSSAGAPSTQWNQPVPGSPKPDHQLKAVQEELARMQEELEVKKSENINFREAQHHRAPVGFKSGGSP